MRAMQSGAAKTRKYGVLAVSALALFVLTATVWLGGSGWAPADDEAVRQADGLSRAFRAASKKVLPTVVKILTTAEPSRERLEDSPTRRNPFKGTPFEDFFNDDDLSPFGPRRHFDIPSPLRKGIGSGVIIDPSGIILTNNHVVKGSGKVTVTLADGREFPVKEIKRDDKTDLAVLKIEAKGSLPAARLGDSERLQIGDWVLAIGNPFQLEQSVSAGIISAKGRPLGGIGRATLLQTDAAINPGNSGGPLVNLDGEVVGINTAIASRSGGYQGIGFAIPSKVAKRVAKQLIEHGSVRRAYLGVAIMKISAELADKLGVRLGQGVLVSEVYDDTPAAKAGMQAGDVIVLFSGRKVGNPAELQEVVEGCPFGSKEKVEIIRNGKTMAIQVVVKSLPKDFGVASRGFPHKDREGSVPSFENEDLGIEVAELTDEVAQRLGYEGLSGVVITDIDRRGIAAQVGLRKGALILRVGRTPVKSVEEFKAAMKKQSIKDGVMLLVRIGGGNRFIVLKRS